MSTEPYRPYDHIATQLWGVRHMRRKRAFGGSGRGCEKPCCRPLADGMQSNSGALLGGGHVFAEDVEFGRTQIRLLLRPSQPVF